VRLSIFVAYGDNRRRALHGLMGQAAGFHNLCTQGLL
jgi:hypothetical protein